MPNELRHKEPRSDYERMLDRVGLDCARYACWKPVVVMVTGADGRERGFCAGHVEPGEQRWLES